MPALGILGYQGQLSEDLLRLLGEKAKATSDLMVRLLGWGDSAGQGMHPRQSPSLSHRESGDS